LVGGEEVVHGALSPDGMTLYAACSKSTLLFVDLRTMRASKTLRQGLRPVQSAVAASPDAKLLAAARSMGGVGLWGLPEARERPALGAGDEMPLSVAFSDDSALLAVGEAGGTAWVYDAATRAKRAELRGHQPRGAFGEFMNAQYALPSLAFSRDGRTLVTV